MALTISQVRQRQQITVNSYMVQLRRPLAVAYIGGKSPFQEFTRSISMRVFSVAVLLALLSHCLFFTGCGGAQPEIEGLAPVSGTVTFEGKPVEGATVTFAPSGTTGRAAAGTTDAEGHFSLTTLAPGDGALAGEYNVAVTKVETESLDMTPEEIQAYVTQHGRSPETKTTYLLPEKYARASESGLTASVKEGEENTFTFDLK